MDAFDYCNALARIAQAPSTRKVVGAHTLKLPAGVVIKISSAVREKLIRADLVTTLNGSLFPKAKRSLAVVNMIQDIAEIVPPSPKAVAGSTKFDRYDIAA